MEELISKFLFKVISFVEKNENIIRNYDEKRNYLEEAQDIHINLKKFKKILNENFLRDDVKFDNIKINIKSRINLENKNEKISDDVANNNEDIEIEFPIKNEENIIKSFTEKISKKKTISKGISNKN